MIRWLFRLIFFVILLLILAFFFAPNLLSTKFGKEALFKIYRATTGNTLTADAVEVSWWKGQACHNLCWSNPRQKITVHVPHAETTASLWQIVFYHDLGDLKITAPHAILPTDFSPAPAPHSRAHAGLPALASSSLKSGFVPAYYGKITLDDGEVQFINAGFDPIDLKNVHLDASLLKTQIKLKSNGITSQKGVGGNFDISLVYVPQHSQIDLAAELRNFPVQSIDQVVFFKEPDLRGSMIEAIGDAMNIQLKLRHLSNTLEIYCDADSPSFSAHLETKTEDGTVTLASPATAKFQVPPALFHKLASFSIPRPFQGNLKIDNFSLPLDDKESFSLQAILHGDAVTLPWGQLQPFSLFLATENFKKRDFTLKIDSSQIQLNSSMNIPNAWQELTLHGEAMLPNNTHVNFSAETLSAVTAQLHGDLWQGSLTGGYDAARKVFFLSQPAQFSGSLSQLPAPLPPLLKEPLALHLKIDPLHISLPQLEGTVSAELTTDPVDIQGISWGSATVALKGDIQSRKGTFQLTLPVGQGSIKATGHAAGSHDLTAHITCAQVPVDIAQLFLKNPPPLATLIGPAFDATGDLSPQQLTFKLSSHNLSADGILYNFSLIKPARLTWTVTPEAYAALDTWLNRAPTPLSLMEPAVARATIPSLDLTHMTYLADLAIDTLAFSGTQLKGIKLHLEHAAPTSPIAFNLSTTGVPEGTIALSGSADLPTGTTQLKSRIDHFPTEALDGVARALGQSTLPFSTLFGPQLNLSATASLTQWNGPLQLQLNTDQIRASLNGTVTQGILTLNDPLHLQIVLTRELSQAIAKKLNPLSLSSFSSEAPITLEIPAQGFTYPIYPSNHAGINIPNGRLELGKIHCHNEGNVNVTLGLLKLSQYSKNESLELWFAPLDFHLTQGILECERTEILLANAYQICTWGMIDFVAAEVDMILGLTASCLKKAFGIKNLPDSYVLQVPMRGPLNDVKINTGGATAKVTALLLWQQKSVAGNLGGGKAGGLLGKFIDKIGPLPGMDEKAPPPKHPFPWESNAPPKSKKTSEAPKNKKHINPDEQPLKQVLQLLR